MKPSLERKRNSFYIQCCINLKNYIYAIYGIIMWDGDSVGYGFIRPIFLAFTVIVIFITYIMFPTNAITKIYKFLAFISGARRN